MNVSECYVACDVTTYAVLELSLPDIPSLRIDEVLEERFEMNIEVAWRDLIGRIHNSHDVQTGRTGF